MPNVKTKERQLASAGKAIKDYRKKHEMGQQELARMMSTFQKTISQLENGQYQLDVYNALQWERRSRGELTIEMLTPWYARYLTDFSRATWYDAAEFEKRFKRALKPYKGGGQGVKKNKTSIEARIRLSTLLKMYREQKNLKQVEISKKLGVSQAFFSLIETGIADLDFDMAIEWSKATRKQLRLADMCHDLYQGRSGK